MKRQRAFAVVNIPRSPNMGFRRELGATAACLARIVSLFIPRSVIRALPL